MSPRKYYNNQLKNSKSYRELLKLFNSNTSTIMLINIADDLDHERQVAGTLDEIS
jgi:3-hydroxyacyl-CoA dehydrogenase